MELTLISGGSHDITEIQGAGRICRDHAAGRCRAFADGHAKLSGDLVIFSDMSNPAPRAVMEGMVERFGEMHPDLNIELTVIDREA